LKERRVAGCVFIRSFPQFFGHALEVRDLHMVREIASNCLLTASLSESLPFLVGRFLVFLSCSTRPLSLLYQSCLERCGVTPAPLLPCGSKSRLLI